MKTQQKFHTVDLTMHLNNVGITPSESTGSGELNVWGNSLPSAELPVGRTVVVDGVPFDFPAADGRAPDNVRCAGQRVDLAPSRHDWLHLLVSAERRVEDEISLLFADTAVDFEALRVSDFWVAEPAFGETLAFGSSVMHYPHHVQAAVPGMIWHQRVPLTRRADLAAFRFPDNVAVHVFAATLG